MERTSGTNWEGSRRCEPRTWIVTIPVPALPVYPVGHAKVCDEMRHLLLFLQALLSATLYAAGLVLSAFIVAVAAVLCWHAFQQLLEILRTE